MALGSQTQLAYPASAGVSGNVTVLSLMASAYALLLFRGTFIPLRRGTKVAIGAAVVAATLFSIIAPRLLGPDGPLQVAAGLAPIVVWLMCVAEPTIRFWPSGSSGSLRPRPWSACN